jgi:hypothetical protein
MDDYQCTYITKKGKQSKRCTKRPFYSGFTLPHTIGYNKAQLCTQHYNLLKKKEDIRADNNNALTLIPRDCLYLILDAVSYADQWSLLVSSFTLNQAVKEWVHDYKPQFMRDYNWKREYNSLYKRQLDHYVMCRIDGYTTGKLRINVKGMDKNEYAFYNVHSIETKRDIYIRAAKDGNWDIKVVKYDSIGSLFYCFMRTLH